jgi:hypothetical protein
LKFQKRKIQSPKFQSSVYKNVIMSDHELIKILFCSDGSDLELNISLSSTLEQLKQHILEIKSIEPKYQRLFHLGREIKNCRRSLHALGLGRYGAFVVHLHSSQPKDVTAALILAKQQRQQQLLQQQAEVEVDDSDICVVDGISTNGNGNGNDNDSERRRKRNRRMQDVDVDTDGDASDGDGHINENDSIWAEPIDNYGTASTSGNTAAQVQVVNLLDSDDDDDDNNNNNDDDDDDIEVIGVTTANKRRRR